MAALYEEGVLKDQRAVSDARLHHKSMFVSMGNSSKLQVTAGLDHFVFYGGYTAKEQFAVGFSDYLKAVFSGKYYVDEAGYKNTVGNQLGQYQFILRKSFKKLDGTFQITHPIEDLSGVRLQNFPDNIYTLLLHFKKSKWIEKVLFEYTNTMQQSGNPANPNNFGTGGDNYFSHSQYQSGYTYYGIIMGNPLFGPVKFTSDGIPKGPENNRFQDYHTGISGKLFPALEYKLMLTYSNNFGRYSPAYPEVRKQFFSLASFRYIFENPKNMFVETRFAFDSGKLWSGNKTREPGLAFNVGVQF